MNPNHLITGTQKQNMEDMAERKRGRKPKRTRCRNGHDVLLGQDCKKCAAARSLRYVRKTRM